MKRIVPVLIALSASCGAPEPSYELASERRYLEPDLVIGSYDEENYSFSAVAGLTVDPLGRIYVSDERPPEVRVYEPGGAFVRTLGRRGEGPGEFLTAGGLGWLGESWDGLEASPRTETLSWQRHKWDRVDSENQRSTSALSEAA